MYDYVCIRDILETACIKFIIDETYAMHFSEFEWVWDEETKSAASSIKDDSREVMFHIDYSCGTAAVRGTMPMKNDQYFWEIKMTTPVYGTDMVGI